MHGKRLTCPNCHAAIDVGHPSPPALGRPAPDQVARTTSKRLLVVAVVGGSALIAMLGVTWLLKSKANAQRLAGSPSASGERWKSPDGAFTIARPSSWRFHERSAKEPFFAAWISQDENIQLFVVRNPLPSSALSQSALEADLASDLQGMVFESRSEVRGAHTLYHATARGGLSDVDMFCSQIAFQVGEDAYYKVIAVGFGKDPRRDPDATAFLNSLTINAPR